jgi:hypothetical protein
MKILRQAQVEPLHTNQIITGCLAWALSHSKAGFPKSIYYPNTVTRHPLPAISPK